MKRTEWSREGGQVSEMAIVDTFAKLIFEQQSEFSAQELAIIQAFRMVDDSVVLDSFRDMGFYLRALGVEEMISLVALVRARLARPAAGRRFPGDGPAADPDLRLH